MSGRWRGGNGTRARRRRRLAAAGLLAIAAVAWRPMLDLLARQMLYPAPAVTVPSPPPPPLAEVLLRLEDGTVVVAWSREPAGAGGPAVLFLHGNGENLETMRWAGLFDQLAELGAPCLAVDYPGYGRSTGTPGEATLAAAAAAGLEWLGQHHPRRRRVIVGWSLGAAVAVQTAARHPVDGVVLLSAWDDLKSLGAVHFPRWLVSAGLRDRYDSVAAAGAVRAPVVMIHGDDDQLIPIDSGRRLHAAFAAGTRFVTVPGAGHNDLMSRPQVWEEMKSFFQRLGAAPAGA